MSHGHLVKGSQNFVWFPDQKLGRGAMGTVYIARHRRKGTKNAAKVFTNTDGKLADSLQRELDILRMMKEHACENIVKCVAIEEETYSKQTVLILELCDSGSLQQIIDQPRNRHGLDQEEFLLVFKHTCNALNHLYKLKIIHRDIKPGNILLQVTPDGRHVYKLTDFGTCKLLGDDDEGFKSLCGTEEYLHPDVHTSAFIRRIPGSLFGHSVDMWSFAVTIYQCATGKLPFRPKQGPRNDRHMMNELMTQKPSGVISRYQLADGNIKDETKLPHTSPLMTGTRSVIESIIARIFDLQNPWPVEDFFQEMSDFCDTTEFHIYSREINDIVCVHIKKDQSIEQLKAEITKYTKTSPANQIILTQSGLLEEPLEECPVTSAEEPLFVVDTANTGEGNTPVQDINLCRLPEESPQSGVSPLAADASWAGEICGNIQHFHTKACHLILVQSCLLSIRVLLNDMLKDMFSGIEYKFSSQKQILNDRESIWCSVEKHINMHHKHIRHKDEETIDQFQKLRNTSKPDFKKIQSLVSVVHSNLMQYIPISKRSLKPSCQTHDRCKEKTAMMLKEALPMYESLREDKTKGELQHNDMEIHKYHKSELKRVHRRARDHVNNHCVQQAGLQYLESGEVIRSMLQTLALLKQLEQTVKAFDKTLDHLGTSLQKVITLEYSNGSPKGSLTKSAIPQPLTHKSIQTSLKSLTLNDTNAGLSSQSEHNSSNGSNRSNFSPVRRTFSQEYQASGGNNQLCIPDGQQPSDKDRTPFGSEILQASGGDVFQNNLFADNRIFSTESNEVTRSLYLPEGILPRGIGPVAGMIDAYDSTTSSHPSSRHSNRYIGRSCSGTISPSSPMSGSREHSVQRSQRTSTSGDVYGVQPSQSCASSSPVSTEFTESTVLHVGDIEPDF